MHKAALALAGLLAAGAAWAEPCATLPARGQMPQETRPAPRPEPHWQNRQAALERLPRQALEQARLVFLGDSLIEAWAPPIWANFYGERAPLNLGVGGDYTESLLWRLQRLPLGEVLKPQVFVLLVGTNNSARGGAPADIALGVAEVVRTLLRRSPQSRVLLLGLLPRGADANDRIRINNRAINALVSACADDERVFYVEPGTLLTDGQGRLSAEISYDRLHLTWLGYAILSATMEPELRRALAAAP